MWERAPLTNELGQIFLSFRWSFLRTEEQFFFHIFQFLSTNLQETKSSPY